jgi:hypothetical protein
MTTATAREADIDIERASIGSTCRLRDERANDVRDRC